MTHDPDNKRGEGMQNEKHKNNLMQSSQQTKNEIWGAQIYTRGHCTTEMPPRWKKLSFPKGALDLI